MTLANIKMTISAREIGNKKVAYDINNPPTEGKTLKAYLEDIKETLLKISYNALKEEQAKGFDPKPIVYVDGSPTKQAANVSPLGKIEFISKSVLGVEVLVNVYAEIMKRSKQVSGTYQAGNFLLRNGNLIAGDWRSFKAWAAANTPKQGDVFQFVNVVPYARRLERLGVTAQKSKVRLAKSTDKKQRSGPMVLAANGTYFLAHRSVKKSYKGNAKITFGWISGATLGIASSPITTKGGRRLRTHFKNEKNKRGQGGPYIYPYIRVVMGDTL